MATGIDTFDREGIDRDTSMNVVIRKSVAFYLQICQIIMGPILDLFEKNIITIQVWYWRKKICLDISDEYDALSKTDGPQISQIDSSSG